MSADRCRMILLQEASEFGSYNGVAFYVGAEEINIMGLAFSPDGTKMFIVGPSSDSVHQYTLGAAWDISTASYDSVSFSIAAQDGSSNALAFSPDGAKMFMLGAGSDTIYQYTLSTGFDLTTASYDSISHSVGSVDSVPRSIVFTTDGTRMLVLGDSSNSVHQYTLGTAWDISTASYDSVSFSFATEATTTYGFAFNADGTKMYISGGPKDLVFSYTLGTGFDIATANYDSLSFSTAAEMSIPYCLVVRPDGKKLFVASAGVDDSIHQYSL